MKANPRVQGSGWDVSFWFAVSSPFLGLLLGILALVTFFRLTEATAPGIAKEI